MSFRRLFSATLLAWALAAAPGHAADLQTLEIATKSGVHVFAVEMARTDIERAQGLMYRKELPEGRGMLFDFEREQETAFWMQNTYISLDMIFIRQDGRILRIAENTEPLRPRWCLGRSGEGRSGGNSRHRPQAGHYAGRPGGASDLQRALKRALLAFCGACIASRFGA